MKKKSIRFLQLADLHLDRPLVGGKLKLPYDKAQRRAREFRWALARAIEIAREEEVDLVLIPGDLWEEDNLQPDTVPFVMDTLGGAGVPVVISPGNHDYYSPVSHYSDEITTARYERRWPENVHIFRDYNFTTCQPRGLEGVHVTGVAYRSNQPVTVRRLGERLELPESGLRLAVIHGSRDDHLPGGKMRTLPFSDEELLAQPFDYVALGHYHARSSITDGKGKVRGAYSGSPCGMTVDETGPRGCLVGTVEPGGIAVDELKFIPLDPRRIFRVRIDISGLQHTSAVEKRVAERLGAEGLDGEDMALVELEGVFPSGSRITFGDDFLRETCFHLRIDTSAVRPEWSLDGVETLHPRTTEEIFKVRMKEMIDEAAARGDETEVERLKNVLYYGLSALHSRPIQPRQVE